MPPAVRRRSRGQHFEAGEGQFIAGRVDHHVVAVLDLALQKLKSQRVGDPMLQHTFERACPKSRVIAGGDEQVFGVFAQLERNPPCAEQLAEPSKLDIDDRFQLCSAQRVKDYDIVDPVEETFPFSGETELVETADQAPFFIGNAADFRARYIAHMAGHDAALRMLAARHGWTYQINHTDKPATDALRALMVRLSPGQGTPGQGSAATNLGA